MKGDAGNQRQAKDKTDLTTIENEGGGNYIRVEMPFNNLMIEFFQSSDISGLIERMIEYIKTQVENPRMPESGFLLDKIMYL